MLHSRQIGFNRAVYVQQQLDQVHQPMRAEIFE
jgi:hypothetical protein